MTDPKLLNTAAMAFMGDAVYEVYVRRHLIEMGSVHSDVLHRRAVGYVCAEGQQKIIKALMENELTEEELAIVKRARNHKASPSKRAKAAGRSADMIRDKMATAFEALLGYLFLSGEEDRLNELIAKAFEIIEG